MALGKLFQKLTFGSLEYLEVLGAEMFECMSDNKNPSRHKD